MVVFVTARLPMKKSVLCCDTWKTAFETYIAYQSCPQCFPFSMGPISDHGENRGDCHLVMLMRIHNVGHKRPRVRGYEAGGTKLAVGRGIAAPAAPDVAEGLPAAHDLVDTSDGSGRSFYQPTASSSASF
jgi:hypothetical protein